MDTCCSTVQKFSEQFLIDIREEAIIFTIFCVELLYDEVEEKLISMKLFPLGGKNEIQNLVEKTLDRSIVFISYRFCHLFYIPL